VCGRTRHTIATSNVVSLKGVVVKFRGISVARRTLRTAAAGAICASLFPSAARGDVWTNGSGDGLWDTSANWSDGTVPTASDPVTFSGTAALGSHTIALHDDAVGGGPTTWQFMQATDNFTLTGGAVAPSNGSFIVAAGKTLTLDTKVVRTDINAGAGGAASNSGTILLNADNRGALSGTLYVYESSLRVTQLPNLGDLAAVSFGNPAVFTPAVTGSLILDGSMTFGLPIAYAPSQTTGNVEVTTGNTVTFTQPIPRFNKTGGGTAVLTGAGLAGGRVAGGALRVTAAPDQSSGGAVEMSGGGVLELIGQRLASQITVPSNTAAHGDYTLRGSGNTTFAGNVRVPYYHTATIATADADSTVTLGTIYDGYYGSTVRMTGPGKIVLTADWTAKTATTIDGGVTVVAMKSGAVQGDSSSDLRVTIRDGGTLEFAWTNNVPTYQWPLTLGDGGTLRAARQVSMSSSYGPPITVADGAHVTLATKSVTDVLSLPSQGIVGGNNGAQIRVTGPGRVSPAGAGTYAGQWLVDNGWMTVRNPAGLGTGTTPIQVGTDAGQPALVEAVNVTLSRGFTLYSGGELRSGNATGAGTNVATTFAGDVVVRPGATVRFSTREAGDVLTVGDSAHDLKGGGGGAMVHVSGPGRVVVPHFDDLAAGWSVDSGTLSIPVPLPWNGTTSVHSVESLDVNISAGAKLDLANNALVIRSAQVGAATGGQYDGISRLVQSGYHEGAWDGPGVGDSGAGASGGRLAVGVARAADMADFPVYRGVSLAADDVVVATTYAGDANLDGWVSGDDYSAIDFAVLVPGASGWTNGDFNYDGAVTGDDYAAIDFNFLAQGGGQGGSSLGVTAVPEPTAVVLMFLGACGGCLRRKRRITA
jgi:hypothetical protein